MARRRSRPSLRATQRNRSQSGSKKLTACGEGARKADSRSAAAWSGDFAIGSLAFKSLCLDNRIAAELGRVLAGTPCRLFRENVKLVTPVSIRYPDVLVTCAAIDLDTDCV